MNNERILNTLFLLLSIFSDDEDDLELGFLLRCLLEMKIRVHVQITGGLVDGDLVRCSVWCRCVLCQISVLYWSPATEDYFQLQNNNLDFFVLFNFESICSKLRRKEHHQILYWT